jgi:hypothetical protein
MKITAEDIAQLLASPTPRRVPAHIVAACRRDRAKWGTALTGLLFVLLGGSFSAEYFSKRTLDEWRLMRHGQGTTAKIQAAADAHFTLNKEKVIEYSFAYTTADGASRIASCYHTGPRWREGEVIPARYLPDDPSVACLVDARLSKGGVIGLFVLVFPVVGAGMVWWFFRQRRMVAELLRDGALAEANVLSVRETKTRVNGQLAVEIVLAAPHLHKSGQLKIKRLNAGEIVFADERMKEKKPVFILHDPKCPKRLIFPESLVDE